MKDLLMETKNPLIYLKGFGKMIWLFGVFAQQFILQVDYLAISVGGGFHNSFA